MRVLFLYVSTNMCRDGDLWFYDEGVAAAVTTLRARGHTFAFRLVGAQECLDDVLPWVAANAGDGTPLVVFLTSAHFSAYAHDIPDTFHAVQELRSRTGYPTLFAGLWATLNADALLDRPGIDMVARGEIDDALADVCDALDRGEDVHGIPNIWSREGDTKHRPPMRPLIDDLDARPFPARDILPIDRHANERDGILTVIGSRGCPMACEFCTHVVVRQAYGVTPGRYIRTKSVDYVLREIREALASMPKIWAIYFHDDMFLLSRSWREEFFRRYPREIGLDFGCNLVIGQINPPLVRRLAAAGCSHVLVGIESGSLRMRELFGKQLSDGRICEALALCRSHGIHVKFYALLGAPQETRRDLVDSFKGFARYCADMVQVQVWIGHETSSLLELDRNAADVAQRQYDPSGHRDAWRLKFYFHFYHRYVALYHLLLHERRSRIRRRLVRAALTLSVRLPFAPELLLTRDWDGRRRWPHWLRFLKPLALWSLGDLGRRLRGELGPLEDRLAGDYIKPDHVDVPSEGWHGASRVDRRLTVLRA